MGILMRLWGVLWELGGHLGILMGCWSLFDFVGFQWVSHGRFPSNQNSKRITIRRRWWRRSKDFTTKVKLEIREVPNSEALEF